MIAPLKNRLEAVICQSEIRTHAHTYRPHAPLPDIAHVMLYHVRALAQPSREPDLKIITQLTD